MPMALAVDQLQGSRGVGHPGSQRSDSWFLGIRSVPAVGDHDAMLFVNGEHVAGREFSVPQRG